MFHLYFHIYKVRRENFDTAHRKVDGIEMNVKVPYHLTIFAIIIEILIFEIVLMRARREMRSSRLRYSPAQFIKYWLWAARWRGKRGSGAGRRVTARFPSCLFNAPHPMFDKLGGAIPRTAGALLSACSH